MRCACSKHNMTNARAGARTAQLGALIIITQYDESRGVTLCAPLCGSRCGMQCPSLAVH